MKISIDAHTRLVALLGNPVEHSLSPLIQNAAFRADGLNFVYVALHVDAERVEEAVRGLRALNLAGANVTAPHKQAVMPLLDELSTQAAAIGAVNTIVCRTQAGAVRLFGDNTDVAGFLAPLEVVADRLHGAPMAILGAGGAARAVAYALLTTYRPERLVLVARTPARAEALARDLADYDADGALVVHAATEGGEAVRRCLLLVNSTPVGTYPHVDATPWPDANDLHAEHVVYDLVYNPEVTRLLREAAVRGARAIGGLEMLIAQAAASYEQWTGRRMPTDAVRDALRRSGIQPKLSTPDR